MNKGQLITAIVEKSDVTRKQATDMVNAFAEAISEGLSNDGSVAIADFGIFRLAHRNERPGRNPQTGETITIPASKSVSFKPYQKLKDAVN